MDTAIFSNMILAGLFVAHLINVRTLLRHLRDQLKRCVDKLSKSTYPSLAPITVFVISGLQSVIY